MTAPSRAKRKEAADLAKSNGLQWSAFLQHATTAECDDYIVNGIWPSRLGEPKPKSKPAKAAKSQQVTESAFMEISTFARKTDPKARPHTILTKSDFIEMFSRHNVRTDKDGKLFSPSAFDGTRGNSTFISASGLCIDCDHGQPSVKDVIGLFPSVVAAFYSTHSHTPEAPRFRVILPLSRSVSADEHAAIVRGVKSIIPDGLMECIDQTCFERARAHYLPSCPPENQGHAFAGHQDGDPLDVDYFIRLGRELEPLAVEHPDDNPQPAPAEVEPPTTFEVTDPTTGEMVDLAVWAAQNPNFDLVAAIDPQYFRNNPNDGKQHIVCPFEDQHTDQGLDLATFAANASPPQYPSWDLHCCHAHCADRDRLEFIQMMLEKGWIAFDQIKVNAPVFELRRPRFVSFQIQEILSAPEWSTLLPDERRIGLDLMMMMWSELDGMVADDDWMIARRLGLPEKEWLSYRETLTRTGWLIESDGRLMNGISKREFDCAQTSYMESIINGSKGGKKARENRQQKLAK